MSGHSKWANIKRKKGASDAARAREFTKLARLITVSVREGGSPEVASNVSLRLAVDRARAANMPKATIERAIAAASDKAGEIAEVIYEGFGPGGVGFLIVGTTDNGNRTIAEIRSIMERAGGHLGQSGSVSYMFQKCAFAIVNRAKISSEALLSISEELNAYDIEEEDDKFLIYFPIEKLNEARKLLVEAQPDQIDISYRPISKISAEGSHNRIYDLVTLLTEQVDIHEVITNLQDN